ncbi:MAG: hypothetical protein GXP49_17650 [Deltaproteobacteria bacterium]|nr:hypothetical protein [Deltaproteobacteria bacterium]
MSFEDNLKQLPQEHHGPLVKLGKGELGGKARGLSFLESLLDMYDLRHEFSPHLVSVPETTVLATAEYERFLDRNSLWNFAGRDDKEIQGAFLKGSFAPETERALERYLRTHKKPLAVRSSSLNEDAYNHPAAGLYKTYMLPNSSPDPEKRKKQLLDAVKLVYASTLCEAPTMYMRNHSLPVDEERMAVVLQEVVGAAKQDVYYPLCAGTAQSINYFPVGRMKPKDGVVALVFGLGKRVVDGIDALRFSPRHPTIIPQFATSADMLKNSQKAFYAVNLSAKDRDLTGNEMDTLVELPVSGAEGHDTLEMVASTFVQEEGMMYPGTARQGRRIVTFDALLKGGRFPMARIISRVLALAEDGFGSPVELEFAGTMDESGPPRGIVHLLQARPMAGVLDRDRIKMPEISQEQLVLRTNKVLGRGSKDDIKDILWVDPKHFDLSKTHETARALARMNRSFEEQSKKYILMAPGRLGSTNPRLGLPVKYPQVSAAVLLAELSTEEFSIEPSQGTHFFHNVLAGGVLYIFLDTTRGDYLDLEWLRGLPRKAKDSDLVHSVSDEPLHIRGDASIPRIMVFRHGAPE